MNQPLVSLLAAATLALGALSCQGNTIGLACTVDQDCDRGQSCFTETTPGGFPGGFCTKGCVREGVSTDCPAGSICTRTSAANPTVFCSSPCTGDSQCRGGQYACRAITNSTERACAP